MKKRMLAMCMAALLLLGTAACGSETTSTSSTGSSEASTSVAETSSDVETSSVTSEEEEIPDFGGARVCLATWGDSTLAPADDEEGQREAEWRAEMEEKYNFKLEYVTLPNDGYEAAVVSSCVAGEPVADAFSIMMDYTTGMMARNLLYPLDEIESWDMVNSDIVVKAVADTMTWSDGHTYGVLINEGPFFDMKCITLFNKRIAESLGIDIYADYENGEWTWDKMREYAAMATTDNDGDGTNDIWGWVGGENLLGLNYVGSTGHVLLDEEHKVHYNSPEVVAALDELAAMKEYWYPINDYSYQQKFAEGGALFAAAVQPWELFSLSEMEDDFGLVPFPVQEEGDELWSIADSATITVIPKNATNPEATAFVLKLLATEPRPWEFDEEGNYLLENQEEENPYWYLGGYGDQLRDQESMDNLAAIAENENFYFDMQRMYNVYWGAPSFTSMISDVYTGGMTAQQTIEANEAGVQAAVDQYLAEQAAAGTGEAVSSEAAE